MPAKRPKSKARTNRATSMKNAALPFAPVAPARPFLDPQVLTPQITSLHAASKAASPKFTALAAIQKSYAKPAKQSASNVLGDPTQSLQTFMLDHLAQYTKEAAYSTIASRDVHLFYVGRDDVHDILKHILSRVTISLYLNMFGFDDSELNNLLMQKALNPAVTMLITLDRSQASGVHEKALLAADQAYNLAAYNTHFVIGESATHQISHTKGFVADGRVAGEGSTNWSTSGEGTFVINGSPGGPGYKAQNNTQSIITDPDTIIRFQTELIAEHMIAQSQQKPATALRQLPLLKTTSTTKAATQKSASKKR
jgi:hypothetical protein